MNEIEISACIFIIIYRVCINSSNFLSFQYLDSPKGCKSFPLSWRANYKNKLARILLELKVHAVLSFAQVEVPNYIMQIQLFTITVERVTKLTLTLNTMEEIIKRSDVADPIKDFSSTTIFGVSLDFL